MSQMIVSLRGDTKPLAFYRGGGVLPMMGYAGRLPPKGVPFSGFKYLKGLGNLSFESVIKRAY